jgi:hypothetical protein
MKRYDENQGYNWWSWMEYLWEDTFNKVEDKMIIDMKNEVLAALIGVFVIPTMVITFGVLSLVMLIPHTIEWAYLSLIRKVDKLIDDNEKPFEIKFIQALLILTTLVVASPFFVWIGPKALYLHIKDKSSKRTRMEWDRLERERNLRREMDEQRERIASILRGDAPEPVSRQPKPDFLPKKTIKAHSLKDKKGPTFVSPGVYTRETDHSYVTVRGYGYYADHIRRGMEINLARERERIDRQVNHVRERINRQMYDE